MCLVKSWLMFNPKVMNFEERNFAYCIINFKCLLIDINRWPSLPVVFMETCFTSFLLNISNICTSRSLLCIGYTVHTCFFPVNAILFFHSFYQFLKQLGLHPNWQFVDVYGMDRSFLFFQAGFSSLSLCSCCMMAREGVGYGEPYWFPTGALVFLFPYTLTWELEV